MDIFIKSVQEFYNHQLVFQQIKTFKGMISLIQIFIEENLVVRYLILDLKASKQRGERKGQERVANNVVHLQMLYQLTFQCDSVS